MVPGPCDRIPLCKHEFMNLKLLVLHIPSRSFPVQEFEAIKLLAGPESVHFAQY